MQVFLFALGLLFLQVATAAAQHAVSGRVTASASGEPLSGVQVSVPGSTVGTITDTQGRYRLTAPSAQATLSFTSLGYAPQQVAISGREVIDVQMVQQAVELEGIVAIGYGERERLTLTESIGVVDAAQIEKVTIASADQAIQGRVPGVQVVSESGIPGAPVAMRIRGVGTVGNTQPLFVIDGVPVGKGAAGTSSPLATINPNDIESISVLKDASAASVYGMQAANGVVLIQTRRGKLGKPTIRYDGYTGVQRFPEFYDLNDSQTWLGLWEEAIDANNAYYGRNPETPGFVVLPPELRVGSPTRDMLLARNTDWTQVGIHQNAPIQSHNASISGATDRVNYYVSGGYFQQDAIVQKWDLTRYSFRANSDFNVTDWLRVGETFSVSNQHTLRGSANYGDGTILNNLLGQPPIFVPFDADLVSPTNPQGLSGNFQTVSGLSRPNLNSTNQLVDVNDRSTRVLGGIYAEASVLDGLSLRTQNSVDYENNGIYFWQAGFSNETTGFQRPEIAEDIRGDNYTIVSTNTANYTRSLGNHDFDLLAGVETNSFHFSSASLQTTGFLNQQFQLRRIVALGNTLLKKGGSAGEQTRLGYIGRLTYDYDDKYLLTASVRRDGVSTFAPGNQWGTFPAFSAGWRISQEPWFNAPWVNELKLRGSWGQLGNSEIGGGEYPHLVQVLLWAEYELGGNMLLAPTPQPRLANAGLTWETNETTDLGLESALFGNTVDLALTYYRRDTEDFLIGVPVPVSSGFRTAPVNVGLVRNSGLELEAGYNNRIRDAVDFSISGNLTTVNNELMSLTEGIDEYSQSGFYRTSVGQPIGYFYGYQTCGVFQSDAEAAAAYVDKTTGANQPRAGDLCFRDLDADGELTSEDRTYLGKTIPDAYFGINLNAAYSGFDFTAFFNGVTGVQRYNSLRRNLEMMAGPTTFMLTSTQDRWTPENPSTTMPRAILGDPAQNARLSDRWVEDGDYLRLKTLQFGYTVPSNRIGIPGGTRVYLSATNLWTLTDYSGLDPEFSTRGNAFNAANNQSQLQAGTDDGNVPQPRMFQIGVTTSF